MEKYVKRSEALWNDTIIGIESIYTVIDGMQINKPKELKELRAKSDNKELFCPCGCGHNLVLVAGDKNLKTQHFRELHSLENQGCTYVAEGRKSVWSKIVLQCWLEDKLHSEDLRARVPLCDVDDSSRKYEFSFLSEKSRLAVNYCRERANLSDEKLELLDKNGAGISIIHIVDIANGNTNGQYPEGLMKVQDRQGFCLLLQVDTWEYNKASMNAVFYVKNIDGVWQEETFAKGMLNEYDIDHNGELWLNRIPLSKLLQEAKDEFSTAQAALEKKRAEEKALREELERRRLAEEERLRKERQERYEEYVKSQAIIEAENRRKRKERELEEQAERERRSEEKRQQELAFRNSLETELSQQEFPIYDPDGNRWYQCKYCGKKGRDSLFISFSGNEGLNLGVCYDCKDKRSQEMEAKRRELIEKYKKREN